MQVSMLEWIATLGILVVVLASDLWRISRRICQPTIRECCIRLSGYIALAILLSLWTALHHGTVFGEELVTAWLTEYSLSIDNLFVFIIILTNFRVPKQYQQGTLFIGIIFALIFRCIFIAIGAIAIQQLSWIFYLFGILMLITAIRILREDDNAEHRDNFIVRFSEKYLHHTDQWSGLKLITHAPQGWVVTPISLVIIALATTDIVFAMDSIPAIYGITEQPYLVVTATICALMGLQQLYFLLDVFLNRLIYLSYGLSIILIFIGIRMILHALHTNKISFIYGGNAVHVPEVSTIKSLTFIIIVLVSAAIASLYKTRTENKR